MNEIKVLNDNHYSDQYAMLAKQYGIVGKINELVEAVNDMAGSGLPDFPTGAVEGKYMLQHDTDTDQTTWALYASPIVGYAVVGTAYCGEESDE